MNARYSRSHDLRYFAGTVQYCYTLQTTSNKTNGFRFFFPTILPNVCYDIWKYVTLVSVYKFLWKWPIALHHTNIALVKEHFTIIIPESKRPKGTLTEASKKEKVTARLQTVYIVFNARYTLHDFSQSCRVIKDMIWQNSQCVADDHEPFSLLNISICLQLRVMQGEMCLDTSSMCLVVKHGL